MGIAVKAIKPHLRCMGAGLVPNRDAVNEENEYSRCVLKTQEREEDRDLTREINRPSGYREVCTERQPRGTDGQPTGPKTKTCRNIVDY